MYFVRPVYAVMGSKNCWMKWLLEACRMTPVHKLPDFRRSHVRTRQRPIMLAETTARPYQPVPGFNAAMPVNLAIEQVKVE
jgi:hypothetical protein